MDILKIGSIPTEKIILDFDITFVNGMVMSISLDETLGDSVSQVGINLVFHLSERSSIGDVSEKIPAEETSVNLTNVLAVQKRTRIVKEQSAEQMQDLIDLYRGSLDPKGN